MFLGDALAQRHQSHRVESGGQELRVGVLVGRAGELQEPGERPRGGRGGVGTTGAAGRGGAGGVGSGCGAATGAVRTTGAGAVRTTGAGAVTRTSGSTGADGAPGPTGSGVSPAPNAWTGTRLDAMSPKTSSGVPASSVTVWVTRQASSFQKAISVRTNAASSSGPRTSRRPTESGMNADASAAPNTGLAGSIAATVTLSRSPGNSSTPGGFSSRCRAPSTRARVPPSGSPATQEMFR